MTSVVSLAASSPPVLGIEKALKLSALRLVVLSFDILLGSIDLLF